MTRLDTRTHRAWTRDNPVLADGEIVAEKETRRLKIGDGVTRYNSLPFVGAGATPSAPSTPFNLTRDAIESKLYDKAYSWELVPGSDVMATTVGVLPKVGTHNSFAYYAGLVTYSGGALAARVDPGYWYLLPADTALTADAIRNATGYFAEEVAPAGVYLGVRQIDVSDPPPYAFPEGWTPGNTTGSGPVLPKVRADGVDSNGDTYWDWIGLVEIEPGHVMPNDHWELTFPGTPLNAPVGAGNAYSSNGAAISPGVYQAVYYPSDTEPPTSFPEGWTFRPYGLGPVAITDENAGGLIGDVAYVVSGYVYFPVLTDDQILAAAAREPTYRGALAVGSYAPGDVVTNTGYVGPMIVTSNFTIVSDDNGNLLFGSGTPGYEVYNGTPLYQRDVMAGDHCWPFIERFDMSNKKWLPRIPLPQLSIPASIFGAPWDVTANYYSGSTLQHNNHMWTANADTASGDEPGVSPKWDMTDPPAALKPFASEGGIAGVIDGKLYFGGGDGQNITGTEFFVYDPADDSITRLSDIPIDIEGGGYSADYLAYGVVVGKLWWFNAQAFSYDPVTDVWTAHPFEGAMTGFNTDQTQGFEIDGKLWFINESRAYVFDPAALAVTAKTTSSTITAGSPFLIDGKFQVFQTVRDEIGNRLPQFKAATYDLLTDTWTVRTDVADRSSALPGIPADYASEFVGVTWQNTPYMLSGISSTTMGDALGVYGLTGVSVDRPRIARLQDLIDHAPDVNWVDVPTPYGISLVPTPLRYCRRRGVVYIEGQFILPNDANYGLMFVLPSGFRPHTDFGARLFAQTTVGLTELVDARLYVQATGEVSVYDVAGGGNRLVDLHASFPADF